MKVRSYFFLLALLLFFPFILFFLLEWEQHRFVTSLGLGTVLVTFVYFIFFYRRVVSPLRIIHRGMHLLREQDFSSRLRNVGQYEADRIIEIFNCMMRELKNERLRLREQNEFLDLLVKASPLGIVVLDHDGRVESLNIAAVSFLGLHAETDALHHHLSDLKLHRIDLSSIPAHGRQVYSVQDGSRYKCTHETFVDRGFPRSFFLIESLTEELRQAEKKAYEKLIRMIAHEVNNTTAVIVSSLDTVNSILDEKLPESPLQEVAGLCIQRCLDMSQFITRFVGVVKIPEANLCRTNLNERVLGLSPLFESLCTPRHIILELKLDPHPVEESIDPVLFDQALLNIIKNAVESIGQRGRVQICTDHLDHSIVVTDNGGGISDECAGKLFTPFFSTKRDGQGIGLLFVREVLHSHHCSYSLSTAPDGLTRFCIKFGD
ncbi:MAG: ATP-binding protein [Porphyromonas sp.]|nr:ATP-binding protein [Porphyromonas sp.]